MVLAFVPLVREAGTFEEDSGAVVEERTVGLFAIGVVRVCLDNATSRLGDEVQRSVQRSLRHPAPPVIPVDEETGESVVGMDDDVRLPFLAMGDSGQFLHTAVLAPTNCVVAVEDQSGMGLAFADKTSLQLAVSLLALPALRGLRVEFEAPTAAPNAIVFLHESGEGIESFDPERFDRVLSHAGIVYQNADR